MKPVQTKKLAKNLQEFGLNPNEWIMVPLETNQDLFKLKLRNYRDGLELIGWANTAGQWLDLAVHG